MHRALVVGSILITLSPCMSCKSGSTERIPDPSRPVDPAKDASMTPTMTDMDPSSPEAWKQAEKLAAKAALGELERLSDELPFMFMARAPAAVLVHKGRVVTDKGPKVAGEYLRDLGIIEGKGPKIDDVLFVLFALDAFPSVEVPKESYVHAPDNFGLADSTARVEFDGVTARVTLVYFLGEPKLPKGPQPGDEIGGMDPHFKPGMIRETLQCVLTIPKTGTGTPAWKIERVSIGE